MANNERRDDSFNSITGLNGSGKSNILDSIVFCLGITSMTTVRAQNLQVGAYCHILSASVDIDRISFTSVDKPESQKPV